ncbi:MAG: hypothetical protein ACPGU1_00590 [Myxococcota bacterium]
MRDIQIVVLILTLAALGACSTSVSPAHEAAGTAGAATVVTQALTRELAAADAVLKQGPKVEETMARQEATLKGARVDRRLPVGTLDGAKMRNVLTAYAKMHGLGAVQVKLGKADTGDEIPKAHTGETPYSYTTTQLIGSAPIAITVSSVDEARLTAFFKAIITLQLPLMVLPTLLIDENKATFSGSVYFRRDVAPAKRGHLTPSLKELAEAWKVRVPSDPEQMKALTSLHAQLMAKDASVRALLAKQDAIALQARVLQFLRTKSKDIEEQSAPKRVVAPPSGDRSPATPTPTPATPSKAP